MTPDEQNGEFVAFWKKVGIVGSGVVVAATIAGFAISFAWRLAMAPVMTEVRAERAAREIAIDELSAKVDGTKTDMRAIAKALTYPEGSRARDRALAPVLLPEEIHPPVQTRTRTTRTER